MIDKSYKQNFFQSQCWGIEESMKNSVWCHMSITVSQITSHPNVCSTACSGWHQINIKGLPLLALCEGNPPVTGEFPSQRGSNARSISMWHDDVIKWKHFPRYWPFARGIHRSWCPDNLHRLVISSHAIAYVGYGRHIFVFHEEGFKKSAQS